MLKIKTFVLFVVLAVLAISAIQFNNNFIKEPPLKGYFSQNPRPDMKFFTWQRWFSQDFQLAITARLNDHTGFRNTLVRCSNQYEYSLFGVTHAPGYISGKQGCLFEEDYIHEYLGNYFVGRKVIDKTLDRLKNVRDSLASHHIPLIFVFEAGKASIYPELIPDRFHPEKKLLSNADYMQERMQKTGIPYLNLEPVLRGYKDTSRYAVFPRYGMHWSKYFTHFVADTLAKYIGKANGRQMPEFRISYLHRSSQSLDSDYDIGDLLNLLFPLRPTPEVYPFVPFGSMANGNMPALVIADSYYVQLVESYGLKMFGKQDYWYYNHSLYPHQNETPPMRIDKSDMRNKLLQYKVVMVMVSDINMHSCLWSFADEAFLAFHPETKDSQLYTIENSIRFDREWFRFMVKRAREQNVSLEQEIRENAEYTFLSNYQNLEGKTFQDSIQFLRLSIKNNPEWCANVTKKAREANIPVDSMMLLDAIYSYTQSKKNH